MTTYLAPAGVQFAFSSPNRLLSSFRGLGFGGNPRGSSQMGKEWKLLAPRVRRGVTGAPRGSHWMRSPGEWKAAPPPGPRDPGSSRGPCPKTQPPLGIRMTRQAEGRCPPGKLLTTKGLGLARASRVASHTRMTNTCGQRPGLGSKTAPCPLRERCTRHV